MTGFHNQMADLSNGFRFQKTEVVADGSPWKFGFIAVAQSHDGPQVAMVFGQVLQLIVREIAAKSGRGQHTDVPVIHALATGVGATAAVNVGSDECQNLIDQIAVGIQILECAKNGNDAVARFEIERDLFDGKAVQPQLVRVRFSHALLLED